MIKQALAIAAVAASALLPLPAFAGNDACFTTKANDRICYLQLAGDGNYSVSIADANYYWPTAMYLECFTNGSNDWESYGSNSMPTSVGEWYADRVCERF